MPNDHVLPITLIASEVAGNAFKHAFPDGREGRVSVSLRHRDGRALLTVSDNGVGMDTTHDHGGLGMKLLRAYSRQLGGEFSFDQAGDAGTRFALSFPLTLQDPPETSSTGAGSDIAADTAARPA